jgi:hypothetical protein
VKKDVDLSRRKFLLRGAGAVLGGALVGSIGGTIIKPGIARAASLGWLPLPPTTIDIDLVKKLAYNFYFKAGG